MGRQPVSQPTVMRRCRHVSATKSVRPARRKLQTRRCHSWCAEPGSARGRTRGQPRWPASSERERQKAPPGGRVGRSRRGRHLERAMLEPLPSGRRRDHDQMMEPPAARKLHTRQGLGKGDIGPIRAAFRPAKPLALGLRPGLPQNRPAYAAVPPGSTSHLTAAAEFCKSLARPSRGCRRVQVASASCGPGPVVRGAVEFLGRGFPHSSGFLRGPFSAHPCPTPFDLARA
jgi:hypothetical protein